jgi:hypothetical protein
MVGLTSCLLHTAGWKNAVRMTCFGPAFPSFLLTLSALAFDPIWLLSAQYIMRLGLVKPSFLSCVDFFKFLHHF